LRKNGIHYGRQNRVGEQSDPAFPLVGTWGMLPNLTEYRMLAPTDCIYYMEINKEIPHWAIRRGTYLLKQTGENTFETVSSFYDGRLQLEIMNDREILLTPLFTLPEDEEGIVAPLIITRMSKRTELDDWF
jgi:hypothetical protein